jgi:hypothetical protein
MLAQSLSTRARSYHVSESRRTKISIHHVSAWTPHGTLMRAQIELVAGLQPSDREDDLRESSWATCFVVSNNRFGDFCSYTEQDGFVLHKVDSAGTTHAFRKAARNESLGNESGKWFRDLLISLERTDGTLKESIFELGWHLVVHTTTALHPALLQPHFSHYRLWSRETAMQW